MPNLPHKPFNDRATFAAAYLRDRRNLPWQMRNYQFDSLYSEAPRKVHCDGRDVGKTSEIEIITAWTAMHRPNTAMLIATQTENHLFPLMRRIVRRFQETPDFAKCLTEMRQTPSWHLRFSNGFELWGRIAGPRGINFQGMHVDWQIVDEAQEMTDTAWTELFQALNGGGRRWVYGVPNGVRNTFHRMTHLDNAEQHNWPSAYNPEFTDEKDEELAQLYGGRDAPGYIHRVLGQYAAPMFAVFNLEDYLACVDESLPAINVSLDETNDFCPPENITPGNYYLGCDLGYARDPSELVVYYDDGGMLTNIARINLRNVNYHRQQEIIRELDAAYHFQRIGIDAGNSGRAVAHQLMAQDEDWADKVQAIDFGATLDLPPLPNGAPARRRTKEFMTELIQRRMMERAITFPHNPDRESQYAAHTHHLNPHGLILYEKGNDHIIDADRCALLTHYTHTHDLPNPRAPRLPRILPVELHGW